MDDQARNTQVERFSCRPAEPGEEGVLATIDRECFPEAPWTEGMFRKELEDNPFSLILLAEKDASEEVSADQNVDAVGSKIMGYVGVWFVADEGHITNVAVRPEHRGKGLARTLLQLLEHLARQRGIVGLTLEVRPRNESALALYEGCGFRQEGRRPHYYEDGEDALLLWKHF